MTLKASTMSFVRAHPKPAERKSSSQIGLLYIVEVSGYPGTFFVKRFVNGLAGFRIGHKLCGYGAKWAYQSIVIAPGRKNGLKIEKYDKCHANYLLSSFIICVKLVSIVIRGKLRIKLFPPNAVKPVENWQTTRNYLGRRKQLRAICNTHKKRVQAVRRAKGCRREKSQLSPGNTPGDGLRRRNKN